MLISMLRAKIHRATVTEANLYYIGNVTIDGLILDNISQLLNHEMENTIG